MLKYLKTAAQNGAGLVYRNNYPRMIQLGAVPRPHYGYIVYQAADLALRLGMPEISVLEFGVAGGRGLLNLEYHAEKVKALTGVNIKVYGFDTGEGLPPPVDYRDLPYVWKEAHFKMDQSALRAKLKSAQLVLGDVKDTIESFVATYNPAPIGAISFDLDYHSSTVQAFKIFDLDAATRLPRVLCYFDDIISSDLGHVVKAVGVPLAIDEFNASSSSRHIGALTHLESKYRPARQWHQQIYSFADFLHPQASTYIVGKDRQLSL